MCFFITLYPTFFPLQKKFCMYQEQGMGAEVKFSKVEATAGGEGLIVEVHDTGKRKTTEAQSQSS